MGGLVLIILLILIPLVLLTSIILFALRKSNESFSKKIDSIYNYIVLLISLVLIIIGVILAINSIADLLIPTQDIVHIADLNQQYVDIIGAFGIIVVSLPLFIYEQKKVNKK